MRDPPHAVARPDTVTLHRRPPKPPPVERLASTTAPGEPHRVGYLYVLPAFAAFTLFTLLPILHTGWLSFFEWNGLTRGTWVGLKNYGEILRDPAIREAFLHSAQLLGFYVVLPVVISLVLVGVVVRIRVRGLALARVLLFLPVTIAMVVNGVAWRWIYAPDGPLNRLLDTVGLDSLERVWLGEFSLALPALGIVGTWVMVGVSFVLLLAGAQKIPLSLYDSARVDGAGPAREFLAVTLPGIRHELTVVLAIAAIAGLRAFDVIFVTTRGGPGSSTKVPALELYSRAFVTGQVGSACAIAMVLTLLIFILVFGIIRVAEGRT